MVNLLDAGVSKISPYVDLLSYLGVVIFVLFLAYLSTKFLSRMNFSNAKNNHIKLVDKFFISQDRSILLIRVEKKAYLIGSDKTGLKLLGKLDENDTPICFNSDDINENKSKKISDKISFADRLKNKL